MTSFFDLSATGIDGQLIPMSRYQDKVVLVVNVASKCGFTPQYTGLEKLYKDFAARGLVVLGFPCNQFGAQEPGSDHDIAQFCQLNYPVSFPLFSKIEVNGPSTHPIYQFLKQEKPGLLGTEAIKWNFTKFLVSRAGEVVSRHAPQVKPEDLTKAIEALL